MDQAPGLKEPTTIDATRFCRIGSEFSDMTHELSRSLAEEYLYENNIRDSYIDTFAWGITWAQLDVKSKNVDESVSSYLDGGYRPKTTNNSGTFVHACVENITKFFGHPR
jgi:hypothetical protein